MFQPLNPTLYRLLELHFHDVDVAAPGFAISWELRYDAVSSRAGREITASGEEYRVNCPFCNDTRKRLYINHMWGVFDPDTKSRNLFLAHCWNEECVDNYDNQLQLHEEVFSPAPDPTRRGRVSVQAGRQAPTVVSEVTMPGPVVCLDVLAEQQPQHPAVRYLADRHFDPAYLGSRYGVSYCLHSRLRLAENRIIIPIRQGDKLVGWQARYIGDDVHGMPFNKAGVPKYWSCPHMCKRLLAYNIERAVQHQTVVIVEGPSDVWSFGPQSLGLLGKAMNPALLSDFVSRLRKYGDGQVVVVLLDPAPDEKAISKGRPHHIEVLVRQLQEVLYDRVFGVYLPEESDPGKLDRRFMRELIRAEAATRALSVSFVPPGVAVA